ncbi:MAG: FAD-binding oxidoreductase [Pseudomonadota bacterium]
MSHALAEETASLLTALRACAGNDSIVTDTATLALFAHDVYRDGAALAAVLRPTSVNALQAALPVLAEFDCDVIARGGGMSYTDTYLAQRDGAVVLDMSRLDQIVEINTDDMYVTVETGCTWKRLADALRPHGVRTPYWGPLSGMRATVGGALSQGSVFLGSGLHGSAADNVQSLDVLDASGQLIRTGSAVNVFARPFYRNFGPDLTGLFTGDCGALGIKVRATLPLKRLPQESRYASFSYPSAHALLTTMAELAREDLVSECFAFDPGLQAQRLKRSSLAEDVKSLARVVRGSGSTLKGIGESLKIAAAGRRFLDDADFSMHVSLDGRSSVDADDKLRRVREIASARGKEVENTIPKVMRADPFANVNSMLGPNGERWVPVHGIVPLSAGANVYAACEAVFERHADAIENVGIETGVLMCTIASSATLVEPCLYWPDTRPLFQQATMDRDYLAKLATFDENQDARKLVATLRDELTDVLHRAGATHFQIGKFYPYRVDADPGAAELLAAIKRHLDPSTRLNPGALGLDRH